MNRFHYQVLPFVGLVVLVAIMVTVATQTNRLQKVQAEWVEYTEHWVDQRQEALEDLTEYVKTGSPDKLNEFQTTYMKTQLYSRVGSYMMDPSVKKERAVNLLYNKIGFTKQESWRLVWTARYIRPFLDIEDDFRIWREAVEHWNKLDALVDSIHSTLSQPDPSRKALSNLRGELDAFKAVSQQYNSELQTEVEQATHSVIGWVNTIIYLLASVLLLSGGGIVTFMYKRSNRDHQKFRTLFDNAPEAVALADTNGVIRKVNGSFQQLFGFSREETIGEDIDDLLTETGSEYKQAKQLTKRLRSGEVVQEETKRFDKEGSEIPVILSALPVTIEGQITNYFAVYTDITHLKRLENKNRELLEEEQKLRAKAERSYEQFKQMFDNSPVAIALLEGRDLRYTYVNRAYHQMFKGKSLEDIVNKPATEIFPEAEEQGYIDIIKDVYDTGKSYYAEEKEIWYELDSKGQKKKLYRNFEYVPLKDETGKTYGILATAVDVTDQVKYRQQLQQQLTEKTTLLEEIHHRVKNNLANITGILQLELDNVTNQEAYEILQDTNNRIYTLANIHELLYESESLDNIRIDRYVEKLTNHLQSMSSRSDQIDVDISVEPFTLHINQAQPVGMLLNEIIQNSYKHAFPEDRQGRIYVSGQIENGTVRLDVGDDGVGIDADSQPESGLGTALIENLKTQLDAEIEQYISEGTHYTIKFGKEEVKTK